jgi:uncharacterized membrane protein YqaE (UPF0057 family)
LKNNLVVILFGNISGKKSELKVIQGASISINRRVFNILYLVAILFPPLAVLLAGKPIQALMNLILTLIFYVPGLIHAILVVHDKKADKRMKQQAVLMKNPSEQLIDKEP